MNFKRLFLASHAFAVALAWPIDAASQVVYRCPGPPVTYSDALTPKEAKEKGCRVIEGEDAKPSPEDIAKKLSPNSIDLCSPSLKQSSPPPDCKGITDTSKRLACFDREDRPSQRRESLSLTETKGRKAVQQGLKDPDSAKFGRCTLIRKERMCMSVNARNSMGGYSGEQQAVLHRQKNEWVLVGIHNIPHVDCIINTVENLP